MENRSELSLIGKLSDISFCDKQCSNVNDNGVKAELIKQIDENYGINVIDRIYVNLHPNMLKNVAYHQHILATLTNGNPYLLYLTRIDNINCCFFIDRKLKNGYSYPKIHCVRYRFHNELFNNTIFTGELVRDVQRRWFFLLSDILLHKGEKTDTKNILSRYALINTILTSEYTPDKNYEVCPIQVKKLFMYKDFRYMTQKYMPNLSYYCKGIIFYTLSKFSNYVFIIPRDKSIKIKSNEDIEKEIQEDHPELWGKSNYISSTGSKEVVNGLNTVQNNDITVDNNIDIDEKTNDEMPTDEIIPEDHVVLRILNTDISDIYNLYWYQKNELTKQGIALVPNMKSSKYLTSIFANNPNNLNICVECRYSPIFEKWVPIRRVNKKTDKDIDVNKIMIQMNKKYSISKM